MGLRWLRERPGPAHCLLCSTQYPPPARHLPNTLHPPCSRPVWCSHSRTGPMQPTLVATGMLGAACPMRESEQLTTGRHSSPPHPATPACLFPPGPITQGRSPATCSLLPFAPPIALHPARPQPGCLLPGEVAASIRDTLGACGYDDVTLGRLLRRDGSGLRHDVGPLRTAQVGVTRWRGVCVKRDKPV